MRTFSQVLVFNFDACQRLSSDDETTSGSRSFSREFIGSFPKWGILITSYHRDGWRNPERPGSFKPIMASALFAAGSFMGDPERKMTNCVECNFTQKRSSDVKVPEKQKVFLCLHEPELRSEEVPLRCCSFMSARFVAIRAKISGFVDFDVE
jgi:hypothetical protein